MATASSGLRSCPTAFATPSVREARWRRWTTSPAHASACTHPRATDALIRALGATPVHVSGDDVAAAVGNREIDGVEAGLGTNSADEGENHVTANLPFFAKTLTLFAGESAYGGLDPDQRALIRKAARQTAAYAAAHPLSEQALMRDFCGEGRPVSAVAASPQDVAALRKAAQPVYAQLERDPRTRALIAAFRRLKAQTPAPPPPVPPPGCTQRTPATSGQKRSPSTVNGTYHWRVESARARAAARATGGSVHDGDVGSIGKMTLRDGKWLMGDVDPEALLGHLRDHRPPARLRLGRHRPHVQVHPRA